jgi:hypothetical protein
MAMLNNQMVEKKKHGKPHHNQKHTGWWLTYPAEKYEFVS